MLGVTLEEGEQEQAHRTTFFFGYLPLLLLSPYSACLPTCAHNAHLYDGHLRVPSKGAAPVLPYRYAWLPIVQPPVCAASRPPVSVVQRG